jgi:hypothetical protein
MVPKFKFNFFFDLKYFLEKSLTKTHPFLEKSLTKIHQNTTRAFPWSRPKKEKNTF